MKIIYFFKSAEVVEQVDALDSKSSELTAHVGSSPTFGTILFLSDYPAPAFAISDPHAWQSLRFATVAHSCTGTL